jgi:hypothetical protein
MTRWILQAKADEPWAMFNISGGSNTYQMVGLRMAELDESWSLKPQTGSFQSERISKL